MTAFWYFNKCRKQISIFVVYCELLILLPSLSRQSGGCVVDKIFRSRKQIVQIMKKVLVTGGTGLVGKALQAVIKEEQPSDEEWFFAGSKDADLT